MSGFVGTDSINYFWMQQVLFSWQKMSPTTNYSTCKVGQTTILLHDTALFSALQSTGNGLLFSHHATIKDTSIHLDFEQKWVSRDYRDCKFLIMSSTRTQQLTSIRWKITRETVTRHNHEMLTKMSGYFSAKLPSAATLQIVFKDEVGRCSWMWDRIPDLGLP